MLAGRLVLVLATLLGASLVWTERPDVAFIAVLALIWAGLVMIFWWLRIVDRLRPIKTAKPG